jgi:hypothetical protein
MEQFRPVFILSGIAVAALLFGYVTGIGAWTVLILVTLAIALPVGVYRYQLYHERQLRAAKATSARQRANSTGAAPTFATATPMRA